MQCLSPPKTYIDKIERPEKGFKLHWDSGLKGFGIRANTTKLTFFFQGRISGPGMKEINVSIGSPPAEYINRPGQLKERSKQEINRHVKTTFEKWKDKCVFR